MDGRIQKGVMLASGLAVLYVVYESRREAKDTTCDELSKYREGLLLLGVAWPAIYVKLFPLMFKNSSAIAFICGCIMPSIYVSWASTKPAKDTVKQSFARTFAKDVCMSTIVALLTTLHVYPGPQNRALKRCLILALLSSLLDVESDGEETVMSGIADGLRAGTFCTALSATFDDDN